LPQQWKESIIVPSNYKGITLLLTIYKILSNILSRLIPYVEKVIGDYQCGF